MGGGDEINSMTKTVQNNISTCKSKKRYNFTIKFQIVFDRFKDEVKLPRKVTRTLGTCSSSLAYLYGYVRMYMSLLNSIFKENWLDYKDLVLMLTVSSLITLVIVESWAAWFYNLMLQFMF